MAVGPRGALHRLMVRARHRPAMYAASLLLALGLLALAVQAEFRHATTDAGAEIEVMTAEYGLNCRNFKVPAGYPNTAAPGNATKAVQSACDRRTECRFFISVAALGDPVNGCQKEFSVLYRCTGKPNVFSTYVSAEANGKTALLLCPASDGR